MSINWRETSYYVFYHVLLHYKNNSSIGKTTNTNFYLHEKVTKTASIIMYYTKKD